MIRASQPSGICSKWEMAGPEIWASKRKELPSTASPTRKPRTANMATRPWVISASRYRFRVFASALAAKPRGSKKPTGGRAPGIVSALNAFLVGTGSASFAAGAGKKEKAPAEPARAQARASFIMMVGVCGVLLQMLLWVQDFRFVGLRSNFKSETE